MRRQIICDIGEAKFQKLSEEEKAEVDLILWAGCCMHKEMNTFKGGCVGLDEYWNKHPDLHPPILLPNRDNAAAIRKAAGTEAAERATARNLFIEFLMYVQHNKGSGKLNYSETHGSLDGHGWERPDVFYAAQRHASQQLPQIQSLLIHFLKKAKESWLQFMSEFEEGGALSRPTPE
ncbi:hypothetical protein EV359DRAFT_69268 [Lentinula novae-zelandiae]|nr:hypothetical protein EV359DRAFT_69268 [Lentinula novae-zelandiae]